MRPLTILLAAVALAAGSTGCTVVTSRHADMGPPRGHLVLATRVVDPAPQQIVIEDDEADERATFVEWHGSYWPAEVVGRLNDGRIAIHYVGWDKSYDEIVAPSRVFAEAPRPRRAHAGEHLFVEWRGSYWPATVLSTDGQASLIRYDGYGAEWDERVDPSRTKRLAPTS